MKYTSQQVYCIIYVLSIQVYLEYTWNTLQVYFRHINFVYQDIKVLSFSGMKSWFYQLRGFSAQTSFYKVANLHQFIKPHVLLNTQLLRCPKYMSDLFIIFLFDHKINCSISLLRKYVKLLCTKTGTKCLKRKDLSFYIFELVTQHFKRRKQALVLFVNDSFKKGIDNK